MKLSEVLLGPDNNIEFLKHFMNFGKKFLIKPQMTQTSRNNLN